MGTWTSCNESPLGACGVCRVASGQLAWHLRISTFWTSQTQSARGGTGAVCGRSCRPGHSLLHVPRCAICGQALSTADVVLELLVVWEDSSSRFPWLNSACTACMDRGFAATAQTICCRLQPEKALVIPHAHLLCMHHTSALPCLGTLCRVLVQGAGPSARYAHTLSLVANRFLVAMGGNDGKSTLGDAWALDTSEKPYAWRKITDAGDMPCPRCGVFGRPAHSLLRLTQLVSC